MPCFIRIAKSFAPNKLISVVSMFGNCSAITYLITLIWTSANVISTDAQGMFMNDTTGSYEKRLKFTGVTNASSMFNSCSALTSNI